MAARINSSTGNMFTLKPMDQHHLTPFDLGTVSKLSKAENLRDGNSLWITFRTTALYTLTSFFKTAPWTTFCCLVVQLMNKSTTWLVLHLPCNIHVFAACHREKKAFKDLHNPPTSLRLLFISTTLVSITIFTILFSKLHFDLFFIALNLWSTIFIPPYLWQQCKLIFYLLKHIDDLYLN